MPEKDHEPPPEGDEQTGVAVKERPKTKRPPLYKVLMHNDDYTTRQFVVDVLMGIFMHPRTEAVRRMLQIHHQGMGVVGVYTREIAETKVKQVTEQARASGFPLRTTMEPDE